MKIFILTTCFFCLYFNISLSENLKNGIKYYTSTKLNQKLPVYNNKHYKIRFYVFVDELSCYTCIKSLINISEYVISFNDSEIILFLKSENFELSKNQLIKQGWKYDIVNDKIAAYKKLYGIKNNPVCLVLNDTGVVKFIGIPGSASFFNIDKFKRVISKLSKTDTISHENSKLNLPQIKQIILDKKNLSQVGKIIQATIDKILSYYLIWSFQSKKLFIYDFDGKLVKVKDFSNFFHPVFTFTSRYKNKIVFEDFDNKFNLKFYTYNLITDSVNFLYIKKTKDKYYPIYTYVLINDSLLVNGYWLDESMLKNNTKSHSFSIYNFSTKRSTDAGIFDKYYYDYFLFNFYHIDFCTNNRNQIVMIQNFSDSLRFYDTNGKYLHSIYINYDKRYYFFRWKDAFSKLNNKTNIEEFKKLTDSVSNLTDSQSLLYDKKKNVYYIIYKKYFINPSGQKVYGYYIHCIPSKNEDIYLGTNKPFYVENGKIYCVQKEPENMFINIFSIE